MLTEIAAVLLILAVDIPRYRWADPVFHPKFGDATFPSIVGGWSPPNLLRSSCTSTDRLCDFDDSVLSIDRSHDS